MLCPLCGIRRARRGCPAVGKQICAVCCGTKRLVQIQCPADCAYLATAREHPAASIVRRQQRDVAFVAQAIRDFSERQCELFFLIATTLIKDGAHEEGRMPLAGTEVIDEDVAEAMNAMAATLETASRGVIYEHRPASLPAERLMAALKPVVEQAGRGRGSAFEREAAPVLRRLADASRDSREFEPDNRRAFLDLLSRVLTRGGGEAATDAAPAGTAPDRPRLIVP